MLSFFPLDVLDEIWDLIESVSEVFSTYSLMMSFVTQLVRGTWKDDWKFVCRVDS